MEISFDEFDFYGLRFDTESYAIGDILPESREWEDGELTGNLLDGTCAVEIRNGNIEAALKIAKREGYTGTAYIIAGNQASYGEDAREIIITDAEAVAILD